MREVRVDAFTNNMIIIVKDRDKRPIDTKICQKDIESKNMYEETSLLDIESIGWFCNLMDNSGQRKREIDLYTEISNEEYLKTYNRWIEMIGEIVKNV